MIREVARAAGAGALVLLLVGVLIAVTEAAADAARPVAPSEKCDLQVDWRYGMQDRRVRPANQNAGMVSNALPPLVEDRGSRRSGAPEASRETGRSVLAVRRQDGGLLDLDGLEGRPWIRQIQPQSQLPNPGSSILVRGEQWAHRGGAGDRSHLPQSAVRTSGTSPHCDAAAEHGESVSSPFGQHDGASRGVLRQAQTAAESPLVRQGPSAWRDDVGWSLRDARGGSGGGLSASPATAFKQPSRPTLTVCSANIQNTPDLPDWKVRADVRKVFRSGCSVVLWQEIRERADHRALSARGWRTTAFQRGGVPVSWRTARVASMGHASTLRVSRATPRCASGRPSYNPARWVTMKPLRARATGQRFTAVSLHFPQRRTCRNADSRSKWWDAFYNTRRVLPAGPLVVGGDWNRREGEIPAMVRMHWVTAAPRSLDHVFVARTGWRTVGRFRVDLWSDHHATGARMRL